MQRVADRVDNARENLDADTVHGLRTALRRCRTMAEALSEVNPDSVWRKVKKSSRELFKSLGDLRDAQVERGWVKKLAAPGDLVRSRFLRMLSRREKEQMEVARKAALFPPESVVFQRLALAKLEEFLQLLGRARKGRGGPSWHRSRIGLKQFRYIAENFVARKFAPVSASVKQLQDLLGAAQDLDVLRLDLAHHAASLDPEAFACWIANIQVERKARLGEAAAKVTGSGSMLASWRAAFQLAHPQPLSPILDRRTA
jgi:CHAD domain-containing protein